MDAIIAAITAALWTLPETREYFINPPNPNDPTVQLEGWLYKPNPQPDQE